MSWWSRLANLARGDRLNRELDDELEAHIEEAIAAGRDPDEVRRAFGSPLRHREASRDVKLVTWVDSLRDDAVFGWRQIRKNAVTSTAAILSLALAIGACTSAFRLIDAILLRPLPVAHPEQLYSVMRQTPGEKVRTDDGVEYPNFERMRDAVKDDAELLAISPARPIELTYGAFQDSEPAVRQYVSGTMFESFGLKPALGRLFTADDDRTPGAHPYIVLSQDYWSHRFGQDPRVIGRTLRMDNIVYEIIGVVAAPFTGTEPGSITDIFVPTMMHPGVKQDDWSWSRTWVRLKPSATLESVRGRMEIALRGFQADRAKGLIGMSPEERDRFINERLLMIRAAAGVSDMQRGFRLSLIALGVLVALVLLIACANVANLMTAQAAARAREMALRVSIGAGRYRLVQLMLVECAWIAGLATIVGALFAWWSAPFIVSHLSPSYNPMRLALPIDWRLVTFGMALTFGVTCLFGLGPALRASSIKPVSALKGGDDPHARRRAMHVLIAGQVTFCVLVLFIAGLFVATFEKLSTATVGFSADRVLAIKTATQPFQPLAVWNQVLDHLREVRGVEAAGLCGWPLMDGDSWNGGIAVDGVEPANRLAFFLAVSPGWIGTMRIPLLAGRDLRTTDVYPEVAIVNEMFVRTYFKSEPALGRTFEIIEGRGSRLRVQVVGIARDAMYRDTREAILPQAYLPFQSTARGAGARPLQARATFMVRTTQADPFVLASTLREEISRARPEFRVSLMRSQQELNDSRIRRERLVALLALFFAGIALLLAGIGLYGVLHYSVLQRRREIGIRIALGAQAARVARDVISATVMTVCVGVIGGLALGLASQRFIEALLYEVTATDPAMLVLPAITIGVATVLAATPAVIRALRIDPVKMLRAD
jgi:putative ABC transport system permease protein